METGITSKTMCSRSETRTLEKTRDAGFENVMIVERENQDIEKFILKAKKIGIKVPYVHLDSKNASLIWESSRNQKNFIKKTKASIQMCGNQGIETVIVHAAYADVNSAPSEIGKQNLFELLETAKSSGVKIAIENMDKEHFAHFEYLLDLEHPNLGFCFDSGHWRLCTPEIDLFEKHGDKLVAIHLHDNIGLHEKKPENFWDQDLHLLPFDGKINFDKVTQSIARTKYTGPLMIESQRNQRLGQYTNTSADDFLKLAHNRAVKLSKMIENYRLNSLAQL